MDGMAFLFGLFGVLMVAAALTAAFAGSAFAQSSVQIYGRVNTTIEYQDNGNDTVTGMKNNASRFGLQGKEDLGGGLNAFFQLEAGFGSDDGTGDSRGLFKREANVGLESANLGKLKLGRIGITSLYGYTIDWIGVFNHNTGTTSEDNIWALPVSLDNAVEYTTPKFLDGALFAAFTAASGENTGPATYEGVLVYQKDALHLAGGYTQSNETGVDLSGFVVTGAYACTGGPITAVSVYTCPAASAVCPATAT
jgi:predicted porin